MTNFLSKLVDMLLFSMEKTEFPFFQFPYCRVLPFGRQQLANFVEVGGWGSCAVHDDNDNSNDHDNDGLKGARISHRAVFVFFVPWERDSTIGSFSSSILTRTTCV